MIQSFTAWFAALRDALVLLVLGAAVCWTWATLSPGWFLIICLSAVAFMAGLVGWNGLTAICRAWDQVRQHRRMAAIHLGTRLGLALLFAALAVGMVGLYPWLSPTGIWITYFNGTAFEQKVCRRALCELSRDYGTRSPALGVHAADFSARGDGILRVPLTANYTFYSQSDDGLRLMIDGNTVIDAWHDQSWSASGTAGSMNLTAGDHRLRVEYYNHGGEGAWRIKWTGGAIPANTVLAAPYLRKRR